MTPPNCWSGASDDYGDSGGVQWTGEQGKSGPGPDPDPQPGPGPAPGPAPGPGGKKCIGEHCDDGGSLDDWALYSCAPPSADCAPLVLPPWLAAAVHTPAWLLGREPIAW